MDQFTTVLPEAYPQTYSPSRMTGVAPNTHPATPQRSMRPDMFHDDSTTVLQTNIDNNRAGNFGMQNFHSTYPSNRRAQRYGNREPPQYPNHLDRESFSHTRPGGSNHQRQPSLSPGREFNPSRGSRGSIPPSRGMSDEISTSNATGSVESSYSFGRSGGIEEPGSYLPVSASGGYVTSGIAYSVDSMQRQGDLVNFDK